MTRGYLTEREYNALLASQGGVCAADGCVSTGPFDADHFIPNVWEHGKPSQILCRPCHKIKTKRDIKAIAKARRIRLSKTQYDKRKEAGGTRIRGRGFDKSLSKRMNGEVIRNDR